MSKAIEMILNDSEFDYTFETNYTDESIYILEGVALYTEYGYLKSFTIIESIRIDWINKQLNL